MKAGERDGGKSGKLGIYWLGLMVGILLERGGAEGNGCKAAGGVNTRVERGKGGVACWTKLEKER